MSGTSADVAQAGLVALGSGASSAATAHAGIVAFTKSAPASDLSQAGVVALTGGDAAANVANSGVLALVEYNNPYFASAENAQAGLLALAESNPFAQSASAGLIVLVSYQRNIAAPPAAPIIVKPNGDIALVWDTDNGFADFQMSGPDLLTDAGLETAIILSLFTDRLADADDVIPDGSTDRRGWWGDAYSTASAVNGYPDLIGSRLWLLDRSILTTTTLNQAQDYAEEALAWMLQDGVVGALTVTVTAVTLNQMQILVNYTQAGSDKKFAAKWSTLA